MIGQDVEWGKREDGSLPESLITTRGSMHKLMMSFNVFGDEDAMS